MSIVSPPGAPVLRTARLTLRAHTVADYDESAALWADPVVTRHIGGRPSTPEEVWARLLRYAGLWSLLGYGYWVVRESATGRFVGEAGLADFRRDISPPLHAPEAGWALMPWAHGHGFATEAVQAVLSWSDVHITSPATVCLISRENTASIRVAEKCGFRHVTDAIYKGAETPVYERVRP